MRKRSWNSTLGLSCGAISDAYPFTGQFGKVPTPNLNGAHDVIFFIYHGVLSIPSTRFVYLPARQTNWRPF